MQCEQLRWISSGGWSGTHTLHNASLVVYFAGRHSLEPAACYQALREFYPQAIIIGCSTGGEIFSTQVSDDSVAAIAVRLDHTLIRGSLVSIEKSAESFVKGRELAQALKQPDLRYILLLADGLNVNGSALIEGIYSTLPESVIVTGGLAGDGADFKCTLVGLNNPAIPKQIAAIGFYGDAIQIGYGSVGGWRAFGSLLQITRSDENILYELDGKPALQLYKVYIGPEATNLPKDALLHPLNIRPDINSDHDIVRTIVDVNESNQSLIFAGDVPEGYYVRLMRGENEMLVHGAQEAATLALPETMPDQAFGILVSCIGRRLRMEDAATQEAKAVCDAFQHKIPTIGFYSYGEICHQQFTHKCSLHNQTMTVTVLYEAPTRAFSI